jgi:hypothetical protein
MDGGAAAEAEPACGGVKRRRSRPCLTPRPRSESDARALADRALHETELLEETDVRPIANALPAAILAALAASAAQAHFKLLEPASWLIEDERGDPQKTTPCGGTLDDPGTPSGAVTAVSGGQTLRIAVDETIYHPGHYRIALARSRDALPEDPQVTMKETERGPRSASAVIAENPQPPVLVDGLWIHDERPSEIWETQIEIPNIDCEGCTLQIIQFMAEHPGVREGGFSYHHCADLDITADPEKPLDTRW